MSTYVPLWVKSNFSFLEGASHPEELVEQAQAHGLPAIAITDRDGVYGLVRAHVRARELGVKILFGVQVSVGDVDLIPALSREPGLPVEGVQQVLLIAQNRAGYANLCQLLSIGRQRCPKGYSLVTTPEVIERAGNLVAVCPSPGLFSSFHAAFDDRFYGLITRHRESKDGPREKAVRTAAKEYDVPLLAGSEVLYHSMARRPLQDVLACIRSGKNLSEAGHVIRPNAEHDLKNPHALYDLYADCPELLERTKEIANRCSFTLDDLRYVYPAESIPSGQNETDWLRELTVRGAAQRYPKGIPEESLAQIDRELELIHDLDYGGYFLTMWEIVQFCRREEILCQGRGSAANSIVCYCLGITAIDPIRMDLLFERFISRERAEPPDIDLDIEHERREEVIQWVYRRYGRRHAAMVANFIRYRARSAVRDVGKALGIPQTALDRVAKLLSYYDLGIEGTLLREAGLDPEAPSHTHLLRLVSEIVDFPRHLSIHPGGFLLGSDPVDSMVPIEPATMEDRTVIQWDKYDVENLGLFKVDLLGLGALTHIRKCLAQLEKHEGVSLNMATIPAGDEATYDLITRGDTVGVFQIESRAQMAMLPRLKPRCFYDLVIEVAIVRPGPIQGDMVHPYLRRRSGKETVEYPHPLLRRVLEKTLGVPIFQEQVMKLAVLVADYTPGEADRLRRDMAAWRSSGRIDAHRERLISRMRQNGISEKFAERVFSQIRGFGEYGFPESHAASFALIGYVTAWLRTHYPAAFTCSLLNAQPMGFYSPATIVEDAKHHGVETLPINARISGWDCSLERSEDGNWAVRMGFRYVKGLGTREKERLERAPGPYPDLDDFVRRTSLNSKALTTLAESGAFADFDQKPDPSDRRNSIWKLRGVMTKSKDSLALPGELLPEGQQPLFARLSAGQQVVWDYRTSMHSTRGHPLLAARKQLDRIGLPDARSILEMRNGRRTRYVGMVICRQRPGTASGVTFFTLEDETGFVNLVVWKQVFDQHTVLAKSAILLGVTGKVQSSEGVVHLIADDLWDPRESGVLQIDEAPAKSRDFH
jgi:error-prone DNA polymerase